MSNDPLVIIWLNLQRAFETISAAGHISALSHAVIESHVTGIHPVIARDGGEKESLFAAHWISLAAMSRILETESRIAPGTARQIENLLSALK